MPMMRSPALTTLLLCSRASGLIRNAPGAHRAALPPSPQRRCATPTLLAKDDDDEIARAQRRRDQDALRSEWEGGGASKDKDDDMAMLRERINLVETKEKDLSEIRDMLRQLEPAVGVQFVDPSDDCILPTAWVFVGLNVLVAVYAIKVLLVDPAASSFLPAAQAVEAEPAAQAASSWFETYLASPGLELQYGEYLDPTTGQMVYPIEGTKLTSSGPLLLLGAGATRLGGILPDEMPFNIVQKAIRAIPGFGRLLPDLRDSDPRKQYQDTWYGTDVSASLPKGMRSRQEAGSAGAEAEAEREAEAEQQDLDISGRS